MILSGKRYVCCVLFISVIGQGNAVEGLSRAVHGAGFHRGRDGESAGNRHPGRRRHQLCAGECALEGVIERG